MVYPPSTLPVSWQAFAMLVPDDGEWRQWIWGALLSLSEASRWEDGGSVTPEEAAAIYLEVHQSLMPAVTVPIGAILEWPSVASIPSGYLECIGQSLLVSQYQELFDVLGYTWGGAGGNFNLPDRRNRAAIGAGDSYNVADNVGSESVSLSVANLPPHHHAIDGTLTTLNDIPVGAVPILTPGILPSVTGDTGNGEAVNNMQPSQATRFIIATGKFE